MDPAIYFGKIHIIEWLTPADARTGRDLFNELEPMGLASRPQVQVSFQRVRSRDEFIAHLRTVADDFRTTRALPLLHIEAHGSEDGLCSAAGDEVLWPELMTELVPLNELTGLRLVVVAAACDGIWGLKMIQPVERAAFLALLGPNRALPAGDLFTACLTFYRRIFQHPDGNAAFSAMNEVVPPPRPAFGVLNAEMLFKDVYGAFLTTNCTDEEISRRVECVVAENARRFRARHGVGMWAHEVAQVRALARAHLEAHGVYFEEFRRRFFFIDAFPENNHRFPITLDDCRAAWTR
jgi:hypothetical protein